LPLAQHEYAGVGQRVVGHEEKRQHGDDALERAQYEEDANDRAQQQRWNRRAARVDPGSVTEEQPVRAHFVQRTRAEELIGVDAAHQRYDHDGANDAVTVPAKRLLGHGAQHKVISRNLVHRQHVEHGDVQQKIDSDDGEHAAENGAGNFAARIAYFFAEINDAAPAVHGVNHRL